MLPQSYIDTTYNNTVDELTRTMSADGYHVLISMAYPEPGEDKYIIWANSKEGKAFRFSWHDYMQESVLGVAAYTSGVEAKELQFRYLESVLWEHNDISADEISDITQTFVFAYNNEKYQREQPKHVQKSPGAKPKLEAVLGKAISSATGVGVIWFFLKLFLHSCN